MKETASSLKSTAGSSKVQKQESFLHFQIVLDVLELPVAYYMAAGDTAVRLSPPESVARSVRLCS